MSSSASSPGNRKQPIRIVRRDKPPNEESTSSCPGPDFATSSSASSPGKRKQPIRPVRRDRPPNEESTSSCPGPDLALSSSASSPGKRKQPIRPVRGDSTPNEGASLGKRQQRKQQIRPAHGASRSLGRDIMVSRKSKQTYGMKVFRDFNEGDPVSCMVFDENGLQLCSHVFEVFTRRGDEIPVDHFVSRELTSFDKGDNRITFTLYSTTDSHPKFVTDKGVTMLREWTYDIPPEAQKMKDRAALIVTMYFGRTLVHVSVKPKNFEGGKATMCYVLFDGEAFEGEPSTD